MEYSDLMQMMVFLEQLIKINGTAVTNSNPEDPDLRSTHVHKWLTIDDNLTLTLASRSELCLAISDTQSAGVSLGKMSRRMFNVYAVT